MHVSSVLAYASLALLARGDNINHEAPEIHDQPPNVAYVATLPPRSDTPIRGTITARTSADGGSVVFTVDVTGLPANATFPYHIHDQPVPADGNCTATLAHLDPYSRGEDPPCDASAPETCQVGDLAGKHGRMVGASGSSSSPPSSSFSTSYADAFVDANPGRGSFFGNRSVVVHFANKTRITCANFSPVVVSKPASTATVGLPCPGGNATAPRGGATGSGKPYVTGTPSTSAPPDQFTGGVEGRLVGSGAWVAVGLGALAFML